MGMKNIKSGYLPMRIAGAAIVVFCAAAIAAALGWIPTSMGGGDDPKSIELTAAPAQSRDAQAHADLVQTQSRNARPTRCNDCGVVESMREIADPSEASNVVRCETRDPAQGIAGGNQDEESVAIATLVAWHVYVRTGMGCGNEGALAPSSRHSSTLHYEIIVVFRDGSRRAFRDVVNESRVPTWRLGDRVKIMTEVI